MPDQPQVYLVVTGTGIHGAYFGAERAGEIAEAIEGVIVALPITADFRAVSDRG
jgi:hypothetical protein